MEERDVDYIVFLVGGREVNLIYIRLNNFEDLEGSELMVIKRLEVSQEILLAEDGTMD